MGVGLFGSGAQMGDMRYSMMDGMFDAGSDELNMFDQPQQNGNQPYSAGPQPQGPQMGFGMPSQPQPQNQQYYQQMRQSIDGMNEAFKQIEQMQMPGQQYSMMGGMFGNNSNRIGK